MDRSTSRNKLHLLLKQQFDFFEPHVYYQPPASVRIQYPCIIYKLNRIPSKWANNDPYHLEHSYEVILITEDPDDPLVDRLASLHATRFDRYYSADNLHHFVYTIYE